MIGPITEAFIISFAASIAAWLMTEVALRKVKKRVALARQLKAETQLSLPLSEGEGTSNKLNVWEQVLQALNLIYAFLPSGFLFFGTAFILANVKAFTLAQVACLIAMALALTLMSFLMGEKKRSLKVYAILFLTNFIFFFVLDLLAKAIG